MSCLNLQKSEGGARPPAPVNGGRVSHLIFPPDFISFFVLSVHLQIDLGKVGTQDPLTKDSVFNP